MLSDDCIAERLRPDICKIVLALDGADFQPVRFDFILQLLMHHIDVFHFAGSLSMENVLCCCCVNDQYWLHGRTRVTHHALDAFASDVPNAAAYSSASALLLHCF